MALRLPETPVGAENVLRAGLAIAGGRSGFGPQGAFPGEPETAAVPHPVYSATAEDVAAERDLSVSARLVGWRYLLMRGGEPVGAVELACDQDGSNLRFAGINRGSFVAATRDAVLRAESMPVVQRGSYELRLLRVPSLYVMALWLKAAKGSDLIVPLDPAPSGNAPATAMRGLPGIGSGGTATLREFVRHLAPAALQRLQKSDEPS